MNLPTQFPVSLRDFLRIAFPVKYEYDREKLYREFVRTEVKEVLMAEGFLKGQALEEQIETDVTNWIASRRQGGFDQGGFESHSEGVKRWWPIYQAAQRKAKASKGGIAKAKKVQKKLFHLSVTVLKRT